MSVTPPAFVIVGRVRNAHGLRGELVVESLTDRPEAVFAPGGVLVGGTAGGAVRESSQTLRIVRSKPFKGGWIVAFHEIRDRTEADLWRERFLLVPEAEAQPLDEGEVFLHELLGMRVDLVAGDTVGRVLAFYELPQGLMLEVGRPQGIPVLVPYGQVVTAVDRAAKVIHINPPPGLLD
jgi:16S rRNA processing protein RimM